MCAAEPEHEVDGFLPSDEDDSEEGAWADLADFVANAARDERCL
jgi:hypothetical protein